MNAKENTRLRALEGLGYCGAVMIFTSILGGHSALNYFLIGGVSIELIVLVRLLTIIATSLQEGGTISTDQFEGSPTEREKAEEITR